MSRSRPCYFRGILLSLLLAAACNKSDAADAQVVPQLDQTDPYQVVAAIFAVAQGRAPAAMLAQICPEAGPEDLDVRRICDYASGFDPEGEFAMFFKEGQLSGKGRIEADQAAIPIVFGPHARKSAIMYLLARDGKWYLSQF